MTDRIKIPDAEYPRRVQAAAKLVADAGLDVLVANGNEADSANVRYFSAYWPLFESGGVASAHAVGNTITMFEAARPYTHGERVAFGIATQLCLDDDVPDEERLKVMDFMVSVGLPVTLEEVGVGDISDKELMDLAEACCVPGSIAHFHVFEVTPYDMYSAIIAADALGHSRRALVE